MSSEGKSSSAKRGSDSAARPSLARRLWSYTLDHPKGVLIFAATLLGLIVVLQNWETVDAWLIVTKVSLPFAVWALIFMLVGYLTGKWIEYGIRQRQIRKGTYKPRRSADDLADATANLSGRLERPDDDDGQEGESARLDADRAPSKNGRDSDGAVEEVDYWGRMDDAGGQDEAGDAERDRDKDADQDAEVRPRRRGREDVEHSAARRRRARPRRDPDDDSEAAAPREDYSPVASRSARESGGRRQGRRRGGSERYSDYDDYSDGGRYGDYGDYSDADRYSDYSDADRYSDYSDTDRETDRETDRDGKDRPDEDRPRRRRR